jgi:tRNA 2-selenouridine synthase
MTQPPPYSRLESKAYRQILLENTPMIDVRAVCEFEKGSIPGAANLPLMIDAEREAIGIAYKNEGQAAALALGHSLVCGTIKEKRVTAWVDFAKKHPQGYLFCMRGGLRSKISQGWMVEAGSPYPLISGGYKALRRFLIEELDRLVVAHDFIVIAGRTGVGKTDFLGAVKGTLDLEGLANHRGSSFGRRLDDQPTQINFENTLAVDLMQLDLSATGAIFIEDEGHRIGGLVIPARLADKMAEAPTVLIEEPQEARIDIIHRDYVSGLLADYEKTYGEGGFDHFSEFLTAGLSRIQKRLGGVRYQAIDSLLQEALATQQKTGDSDAHRAWIKRLLDDYYDPMYEYQLANKQREVLFTGSRADAIKWAQTVR